jgi:hypothetical protein
MKVPTFEEAIQSKNIFNYEVHRNVLGWQLSYVGEDLAVCISSHEARALIDEMGLRDLRDSEDEQERLNEENV